MQLMAAQHIRTALKFAHLLAVCIWTGGGMTVLVLLYDDRQASGSELSAFNLAIRSIDDYLIKPAAAGTLGSGVLLCLLGTWGLLRQRWIVAKLGITLVAIAFGACCLGPWLSELAACSASGDPAVSLASGYQRLYRLGVLFGSLQTLVLLLLVLLSIVKPDLRLPRRPPDRKQAAPDDNRPTPVRRAPAAAGGG